jgi:hypothetical protein
MITKEEVKQYEETSMLGLTYKLEANVVSIFNKLNEKIAELNLAYAADGIYNDAWFGFVTGDEYKEIMNGAYFEFFRKTKCVKKVCNTLGLEGGMEEETAAWFSDYMMPKMLNAGLQYNSIVIPENIFAQQTMDHFESNLGNKLGRLFGSQEKAIEWLKSV